MLRVLVMVSGGGTNLQAILDSVQSGEITDTEIVGVISNNPGAYALERGEKAGVPVVPGFLVKKEKDIDKGVKKLKLPLIAKPDNGVGAAATYKLQDKKDVENFKKEWDGKTAYFLEPFVSASDIVTFDGIVDAKGNIAFATSIVYYYTPLELLNNNSIDWVYYIDKELDPKLVEYGEKHSV